VAVVDRTRCPGATASLNREWEQLCQTAADWLTPAPTAEMVLQSIRFNPDQVLGELIAAFRRPAEAIRRGRMFENGEWLQSSPERCASVVAVALAVRAETAFLPSDVSAAALRRRRSRPIQRPGYALSLKPATRT
jgi:hypothetical protein